MSMVNVARASLDHLHAELQARYKRVRLSLACLKNQDSEYAAQHRILLTAYSDLLAVTADHLGRLTQPPKPAPVDHSFPGRVQEAPGPQCPGCASPSWPTETPGVWHCTHAGCVIARFGTGTRDLPAFNVTHPAKPVGFPNG
jgi:hypothetical protein